MEAAEHSTEADPLKRGEDRAEIGQVPSQSDLKKNCRDGLALAKLSHWRTAVFFFSLFLCLTIVFAFSFIIPCPVRPQYLTYWNRTFSQAETFDFLAIEEASKDKVMDVLFVLKDEEGTQNNTCTDKGLPTPCVFVMAVAGTDGKNLWECPLAPEFHWAQCGLDSKGGGEWDCLLFHSDQLTAIDKYTGIIKWQRPHPSGLTSTLPVLSLPDLDGDGVREVALVAPGDIQTQMVILSGKTGVQIGSEVVDDFTTTNRHLLHSTDKGSQYVLLQRDTGLYGLALWKIAARAKAGMDVGLKKDKLWESKVSVTSDLVPIYESNSVRHVLRTSKDDDPSSLLVVSGEEVVLVDGNGLQRIWSFNTTTVLREPSFGHFNKDGILDVVIEEDIGNNTKRLVILDGKSGAVLWEVTMLASPNSPRPASINTINTISVFMFWGMMPVETNVSVPLTEDRRSYMLHPLYDKVLLESTNVMDHIYAFKATLLERGRHACYIMLTGQGSEGGVVLSKRKLKEDVLTSRVRRMGPASAAVTNDDIKEAFKRLRFSDD